ncbi:pinin-like [Eriocheir sinensis]|uniref:pinin-like n=1 Tax=Eriocheir sinensis TaxID=95602 RepID=UPI0021C654B2|nr:pinin-like [Eriocheir sinensis]XP_050732671.1 pinin-like [Eriocheir sinensis]
MIGRGRMRRGVSLEVIVEEDDNAEVTYDPLPPYDEEEEEEEEEDEEEDEDEDSENGRSSARRSASAGGGGGGGSGGGATGVEERRKKRERRRTLALSRLRSVSCETLTLLDTSDMDSCCSEWDDDEHQSAGSKNYVTINRPISRRRILESNHCDSEDSGIEYQSNEDETNAGDQSGSEERQAEDQSHVDIHEAETATESEGEDDSERRVLIGGGESDASRFVQSASASHSIVERVEEEEKMNGEEEEEEKQEEEEITEAEMRGHEEEESAKMKIEEEKRKKEEEERGGRGGGGLMEMSPREVLENDNVVIVEKTTSTSTSISSSTPPHLSTSVQNNKKTKKTTSNQHGKREGEEETNAEEEDEEETTDELRQKRAAYTIRNKEVQLEELPAPHTVRSVRQLFENQSAPLGHLRAWRDLGRFRAIKSNPSSKILRFDRSDSTEGQSTPRCRPGSSFTLPRLPSQRPSPPTPFDTLLRQPKQPKTPSAIPRPKEKQERPRISREVAETESGNVVQLRKPSVRGFNVKKALQEDPRTFHAHAHSPAAPSSKATHAPHIRRSLGVKGRALHPSEVPDRSDTESLSSDISEDSGVSNDSSHTSSTSSHTSPSSTRVSSTSSSSTSSSSTSIPKPSSSSSSSSRSSRSLDANSSDPSFKWIDPAVMAKIRSVGTTVIFFGPRQRAAQNRGSSCDLLNRPLPKHLFKTTPPAAPRIVGVLRKKSPAPTLPGGVGGGGEGAGTHQKWKKAPDTSVIYDFTRHQVAPWM